ncbi:HsdM family class I SAM-dependent methyltransferase [Afifella sp. YEN Y35]|uniref:HsdM family class I SAM-dependent methyltransferase n=1 Tax=Afifella sp. YEN Y35 TaxID=3388337 RepID=UPI0039E142F3
MTSLEDWLSELAYTDFSDELFRAGASAGTRPYASEIEEMLASDRGIGASAVFCVGELPTVCFIDAASLSGDTESRIEQIRQKVWNQNLASVVLVVDPTALTAYSVVDREAEPDTLPRSDVARRGSWSAYEVQSGFIKDRLSDWFSPDARVDQRLLANLRQVVKSLVRDGLSETQAEALMAQVIFLCYLEQRGIVGQAYRETHGLEVLEAYVSKQDGTGIDNLLKRLGADFNGDFLSSKDGGAPQWSNLGNAGFRSVKLFLEAVDFETGQGSFWRYDFSHIPVELISGIYETLLKDRQGKLGAYYTPRHLANLVSEQAFEHFDDPTQCTVYDGACGSGILLTTAFRKMLRHAEVTRGRRLRFAERVNLMERNLFGNDLDETACWITAFSLYLSLLEGLDPADISLLQSDEDLKLPTVVGVGRNIQKGERHGDFFSASNPFAGKKRFDIFLCNPPWRESDDDETPTWEAWCREQDPPYPIGRRQIAAGFAYRAMQSVKPSGVVTLIMPLNLVIGATSQSSDFRQRWLEDARIERIINFGDVRRLLFPAAKHPCAVVRARPRPRVEGVIALGDEEIEYWAPKTDVSLALGRLALHAVDHKLLSARDIYTKPYLLISAYWGEQRDLELLRRLQKLGSLDRTMTTRTPQWVSGKGFHAPNLSNPRRSLGPLENLAFLSANRMPHAYPVIATDAQLDRVRDHFTEVASPGGKNARLYGGPRVILPDGLTDDYTIRAVYTDLSFAFTSSIGAIGGDTADAALLKFLAAYLRSPIATYLLILTGYSVIGERPRIAIEDMKAFPFCAPEKHPDPDAAERIVAEVAATIDTLAAIPEWQRDHGYTAARHAIDELVFDYFQLSASDRLLVRDMVGVVANSIQPADYAKLATPLLHRPSAHEVSAYVDTLARELETWRNRSGGQGGLSVEGVVDGANGFFGAVRISLRGRKRDTNSLVRTENAFQNLLADIETGLGSQLNGSGRDDLFKVPNAMVVVGDAFYFVKPMRRRFWLSRSALADADHVVRTVQAAAWEKVHS